MAGRSSYTAVAPLAGVTVQAIEVKGAIPTRHGIREAGAGGSNPLTPTSLSKHLATKTCRAARVKTEQNTSVATRYWHGMAGTLPACSDERAHRRAARRPGAGRDHPRADGLMPRHVAVDPHAGLVLVRPAPAIGRCGVVVEECRHPGRRSLAAIADAHSAAAGTRLRRVGVREVAGSITLLAYHPCASGPLSIYPPRQVPRSSP